MGNGLRGRRTRERAGGRQRVRRRGAGRRRPGQPLSTAPTTRAVAVSGTPAPFGLEEFAFEAENEYGEPESQAGAHPFQLTTVLNLNIEKHTFVGEHGEENDREVDSGGFARELRVNLPPGLVGDVRAVPQCSDADFNSIQGNGEWNTCPADTAVGATSSTVSEVIFAGRLVVFSPVYNLVPAKGEPARLGFIAGGLPITLRTELDGGDYHVITAAANIPESLPLLSTTLTVWGNPGDPRHDSSRGAACLVKGWAVVGELGPPELISCEPPTERPHEAFLTMPTQCSSPLRASVEPLSGRRHRLPGTGQRRLEHHADGVRIGAVQPVDLSAAQRTRREHADGGQVARQGPQTSTLEEGAIGEADLQNAVVKLPAGVQLNPSSANGLSSCSESAIGLKRGPGGEAVHSAMGTIEFEREEAREESAGEQAESEAAGRICPAASKVGDGAAQDTATLEGTARQRVSRRAGRKPVRLAVRDLRGHRGPGPTGAVVKLAGEVRTRPRHRRRSRPASSTLRRCRSKNSSSNFQRPRASSLDAARQCGTSTTTARSRRGRGRPPVRNRRQAGWIRRSPPAPRQRRCPNPSRSTRAFRRDATTSQAGVHAASI